MPGASGSFRVLVVEDEYFIANDLARALRRLGAEVVGPVADAESALDIVLNHKPGIDGALLDINLRGDMAFSVADALRARGIPFGFATGYDPAVIPSAHRAVPRWEKPFDIEKVAEAIAGMARR